MVVVGGVARPTFWLRAPGLRQKHGPHLRGFWGRRRVGVEEEALGHRDSVTVQRKVRTGGKSFEKQGLRLGTFTLPSDSSR